MLGLYRDIYRGFTVKHFHQQMVKRHNYVLGYTVTKLHLQREGLVVVAKKRSAHRKKRPRRPLMGMMLHQDVSAHAWLPGDRRKYDLVVTMEDATSALYSVFLVDEEGVASSFQGLREVIAAHGLFCSLYTDRGSHYFFTPEAGGKVSKTVLTQVGRSLSQLGIEHIAAYSPQARGRSKRVFLTETIETCFRRDLLRITPEAEVAIDDVDGEVLTHLAVVQHGADRETDLGGGVQSKLALAANTRLDPCQFALCGHQQVLAFARPLPGEIAVTADDQPLARELLGRGDLGQVAFVE